MVRQFQQSYFHDRFASTDWGYSAPDFSKVASAYGIRSAIVSEENFSTQAWTGNALGKPL